MTHLDPATSTTDPDPADPADERRPNRLVDVAVIVGLLAGLGVLGGLLWWQVVDLPRARLGNGKVVLAPADLTRQVGIDGWYALIALGGGVLAGVGLTAWRRSDPVVTVAAASLGACVAAWVMRILGRVLGPGDPADALRSGHPGSSAPVQLVLHATGVVWLWPVATAAGSLVWLYLTGDRRREDDSAPRSHADSDSAAVRGTGDRLSQ